MGRTEVLRDRVPRKRGLLVVPILLCSVPALAIFLERMVRFAILLRRGRHVAERVAEHVQAKNREGAGGPHGKASLPWAGCCTRDWKWQEKTGRSWRPWRPCSSTGSKRKSAGFPGTFRLWPPLAPSPRSHRYRFSPTHLFFAYHQLHGGGGWRWTP